MASFTKIGKNVSIQILSYLSSFDIMGAVWFTSRSFHSYCRMDTLWTQVILTLNQSQLKTFVKVSPSKAMQHIRFILPPKTNDFPYQRLSNNVPMLEFKKSLDGGEIFNVETHFIQNVERLRVVGYITLSIVDLPTLCSLKHLELNLDYPAFKGEQEVEFLYRELRFKFVFRNLRVLLLQGDATTTEPDWWSLPDYKRRFLPLLEHFTVINHHYLRRSAEVLTRFWLPGIGEHLVSLVIILGDYPERHGIRPNDLQTVWWPKLQRIVLVGFTFEAMAPFWEKLGGPVRHLISQNCEAQSHCEELSKPIIKIHSFFLPRSDLTFSSTGGYWSVITDNWILLVPKDICPNQLDHIMIRNTSWKIRQIMEPFPFQFFLECWKHGTWLHLFHQPIEERILGQGIEKHQQFCDLESILVLLPVKK